MFLKSKIEQWSQTSLTQKVLEYSRRENSFPYLSILAYCLETFLKEPAHRPALYSSTPEFPIGLRLILLIFSTGRINALSISDLGDHWKAVNSNRSDSKVLVPPYGRSWLSQGSVPHRQILDRTVTTFDLSTCVFYDSWWPVVYFEMG